MNGCAESHHRSVEPRALALRNNLLAPLRPLIVLFLLLLLLSLLLFLLLAPELLTGAPPISRTITITIATAIALVIPVMRTGAAGALSAH